VFAVLLSTLLLAAADPAPAATMPMADPGKPKAPEMVCHNEERVCVTREEADKAQQAAQDTMTGLNRRPKAADKPAK
jgi:hypothetical protein